jgi:hypothetical protein
VRIRLANVRIRLANVRIRLAEDLSGLCDVESSPWRRKPIAGRIPSGDR